jgi:hypothetical protein
MSRREAARIFGINRRTVEKMLRFSIPPGYRRDKAIRRPKLGGFTGIIEGPGRRFYYRIGFSP